MEQPLIFNQQALKDLTYTAKGVMSAHPEIVAVLTTLVFQPSLSNLEVDRAIWIGREGPVSTPHEVIGSLEAVLSLASFIFQRGFQIVEELKQNIYAESQKLLQIKKEIEHFGSIRSHLPKDA